MLAPALLLLLAADGPIPRFANPEERKAQVTAAIPEIDALFDKFNEQRSPTGMIYGIILDGQLIHTKSYGMRERSSKAPVTPQTRFRIASMTKSFTAMCILKLRDEGKLSLEDPASKYIPEMAAWKPATKDADPIRVRHLLTHGAGFPEDNPWGDQQLGISDDELTAWLKKGVPFSTSPGTEYEYSNYGFALLGRIITVASGTPYKQYLEREILKPLGMTASTLEPREIPKDREAVGYRRKPDGSYEVEPSLPHGGFGAMGGLATTVEDLAKYVAYLLSAYPARDEDERGPVRRSSLREMQSIARESGLRVEPAVVNSGYGYGLGVSQDCKIGHLVGHGGGLPGFGSYMMWAPNRGIGLIAMTNHTYTPPTPPILEAIGMLVSKGAIETRKLEPSPVLTQTQQRLVKLFNRWNDADAKALAAMNLFLDYPIPQVRDAIGKVQDKSGAGCKVKGPVEALNWLRGSFVMGCEKGDVHVRFTLAPTQPPTVQMLRFSADPPRRQNPNACVD
jgi:CubicO group peptidase (beta-lactamase class C family)